MSEPPPTGYGPRLKRASTKPTPDSPRVSLRNTAPWIAPHSHSSGDPPRSPSTSSTPATRAAFTMSSLVSISGVCLSSQNLRSGKASRPATACDHLDPPAGHRSSTRSSWKVSRSRLLHVASKMAAPAESASFDRSQAASNSWALSTLAPSPATFTSSSHGSRRSAWRL